MAIKKRIVCYTTALILLIGSTAQAQYDRAESVGDFALPVTLLSFSATGGYNSVILSWKTASEVDLWGFNVYRSTSPGEALYRMNEDLILSQGTGPELNEYQYIDYSVESGSRYTYKLSTLEFSGTERFIGTSVINYDGLNSLNLTLELKGNFPAPFNSETKIAFSVFETTRVTLQIYDLRGQRIVILLDRILSPGEYFETFSGDQLPSGIYFCRLQGENGFDRIHKMILLR